MCKHPKYAGWLQFLLAICVYFAHFSCEINTKRIEASLCFEQRPASKLLIIILLLLYACLRRCYAGDGDAEWAARYVVHAEFCAELH